MSISAYGLLDLLNPVKVLSCSGTGMVELDFIILLSFDKTFQEREDFFKMKFRDKTCSHLNSLFPAAGSVPRK